jgi:hypothetical protein
VLALVLAVTALAIWKPKADYFLHNADAAFKMSGF